MMRIGLVLLLMLSLTGCASFGARLKSFLGGSPPPTAPTKPKSESFSNNPNYMPSVRRKYKRATKESFAHDAELTAKAGSLWVMEGQGAYLFSQNIMRMIGDPIPVRVEGEPRVHLETKVSTINTLLARLEQRRRAMVRGPATAGPAAKPEAQSSADTTAKPDATETKTEPSEIDDTKFNVKTVPTRVMERMVDGNYRVKGSQPFMIGTREYKVIVTGIVRAEDFSEEGVSAEKLLDASFDIVSNRRKETN